MARNLAASGYLDTSLSAKLTRLEVIPTNFEFPWPLFDGVLEGISILDAPRLELESMEEATNFIEAYGFDPNSAEDLDVLWKFFDDSVVFIESTLGGDSCPKIPGHLRSREAIKDVRRLLLLASGSTKDVDQQFSCAILRVMHVLIHLGHDPRLKYFDEVQNQILGRLDKYLFIDETDGATYLGNKDEGEAIKLLFFKKKDRKDRDREIIKLLHKKDALIEDIYDRIGFRLVTETKFESLRALRLLIRKNIISVPNVRSDRSRNRLVDLKRLHFEVDRIRAHIKKSGESAPYIAKMIRRLERRISHSRLSRSIMNPHTSGSYRAIQFTCRELVKVRNARHRLYEKLKKQLDNIHGGNHILHEVFPKVPSNAHDYVFFPYEIQIMDVKSYADSIFGQSNHDEYRRKQLEAARRRVFRDAYTKAS